MKQEACDTRAEVGKWAARQVGQNIAWRHWRHAVEVSTARQQGPNPTLYARKWSGLSATACLQHR